MILILVPFLMVLANFLLLMPELEPAKAEQVLELLKDAENRFRENGSFRKRIWLDSDSWLFQPTFASQAVKITVPSCWNSLAGMENYDGKAVYQLDFLAPGNFGPRVFLHFSGVSYQALVKLNDKILGSHQGAYTPFEFEITEQLKRTDQRMPKEGLEKWVLALALDPENANHLEVEVDNRLSMKTIPGKYKGWKHIGGIYREVYLEAKPEVFIKDVKVIAEPVDDGGHLKLEILLDNALKKSGEFTLLAELAGNRSIESLKKRVSLNGEDELRFDMEARVSRVKPWSPEKPRLYQLKVELWRGSGELGFITDEVEFPIGFRKLETKGNKLFLNGKPFKVRGISRHNFYPVYYQTIPPELVEQDLAKIKDLGANLVRLGHYPNHPFVLSLCDRLGLLVWEEIPAWGKFSPDYNDPEVIALAKAQLEEMLIRDRNHPSLVIVGLANEIPSDKTGGQNFIKALSESGRALVSDQLMAIASDRFEKEMSAQYVDLLGLNSYLGWYGGKVDQLEDILKRVKSGIKDKPVLISEYGADSQVRRHGASGDIFSEENQAALLKKAFKIIEADPEISGGIIWVFADYPDPIRVFNPKPFFNQKGLLSEDRKEKLGFKMASALYQNEKIELKARSRIQSRIRDSVLAGLVLLGILLGLVSRIPEKWILLMPGLTHPIKLLRRAIILITLQTLVFELIWESFLAHQPLALPISLSYPSMKFIQVVFNSWLRPIFIFLFLFWLWWLASEFFSLLLEKRKAQIPRHPFEVALGVGDPMSIVLPYPMLTFFPALIALALNLPSWVLYGKFLNQFSTIPWIIFQVSYTVLVIVSLIKLPLVLRTGFQTSFFRAVLYMLMFFIFANAIHALLLFFLYSL